MGRSRRRRRQAERSAILEDGLKVADLREGERSIDQLWKAVFPGRAVPAEYDFRMIEQPDQRIAATDV